MIVFNTDLPANKINFVYNNNIIEWTDLSISSSNLGAPTYTDITILGNVFTIYPQPNGVFYFNLKEILPSLLNTDNFQDLKDISLNSNVASFVYGQLGYFNPIIRFDLFFENEGQVTAYKTWQFLRGVLLLQDFKRYNTAAFKNNALLPHQKNPYDISGNKFNTAFVKYWEGYPFDITFYTPNSLNPNTLITNLSNSASFTFPFNFELSRLVFSDGRTDITLELFLPLTDGTNPLLIGNDFVVEVEKMTPEEGVYLKWLNNLGGWTYWLLSCIYSEEDKRKLIGQLENDFSNLDQTTSPLLSLGIDTQTKISGTTNFLNAKENETFKSIFQSPKVYLFTGERFSKNKFNDWIEVQIGNQNITTKNLKQKEVVYSIDINLPKNNTMKL